MDKTNERTILMAQIESKKGVDNLEQILDVEGIDAAFVGPHDLTQSLGIIGQKEHPKYLEAIDKIIRTAKQKNKFSGIHMMDTTELQGYLDKGMTCNLWSNDVAMLMSSAKQGLAELR
jgi:2-keto-3-deoxy-L-rhamnonate aldolase RhmA